MRVIPIFNKNTIIRINTHRHIHTSWQAYYGEICLRVFISESKRKWGHPTYTKEEPKVSPLIFKLYTFVLTLFPVLHLLILLWAFTPKNIKNTQERHCTNTESHTWWQNILKGISILTRVIISCPHKYSIDSYKVSLC